MSASADFIGFQHRDEHGGSGESRNSGTRYGVAGFVTPSRAASNRLMVRLAFGVRRSIPPKITRLAASTFANPGVLDGEADGREEGDQREAAEMVSDGTDEEVETGGGSGGSTEDAGDATGGERLAGRAALPTAANRYAVKAARTARVSSRTSRHSMVLR
jgi:hypothetical protein